MNSSRDGAGLPVALILSVLLLLGVTAVGVGAGPDVLAPNADSMAAPEEPTVPTEAPEEGEETPNETYLREALGSDFEIDGNELIADGSEGLPDELTAYASVVVQRSDDDELSCEDADDAAPGDDGTLMTECEERTVDGRRTLLIGFASARHSASGSNFGERTVRRLRPDGTVVTVQLSVLGRPSDGSTTELEKDVSDWLNFMKERLIVAALDDRMRATSA